LTGGSWPGQGVQLRRFRTAASGDQILGNAFTERGDAMTKESERRDELLALALAAGRQRAKSQRPRDKHAGREGARKREANKK
jgi:hypothetical protein